MDNRPIQDLLFSRGPSTTESVVPVVTGARPGRILVVEDDRHIARLLDYVLRRAGYQSCVADTAEQGLAEIISCQPDALLLDLVLPQMTGLEFLRAIRAAPYFSKCIVIVLSGHWVEQASSILIEAGASAQCSKPIAPSTLLRKLREFGVTPLMPADAVIAGGV